MPETAWEETHQAKESELVLVTYNGDKDPFDPLPAASHRKY